PAGPRRAAVPGRRAGVPPALARLAGRLARGAAVAGPGPAGLVRAALPDGAVRVLAAGRPRRQPGVVHLRQLLRGAARAAGAVPRLAGPAGARPAVGGDPAGAGRRLARPVPRGRAGGGAGRAGGLGGGAARAGPAGHPGRPPPGGGAGWLTG